MPVYVEELAFENNLWVPIMGLAAVAPSDPIPGTVDPISGPISDRLALRDDGVLDGTTRDSYDSSLFAKYPLNDSNWGLLPGYLKTDLTVVSGDKTYSDTSGTLKVIRDTWFTGNLTITGSNYEFNNCYFGGNSNTASGAIINAQATSVRNLVFNDCEFKKEPPNNPNGSIGIYGHHFTLRRCKVHGTEDGVRPYSSSGPMSDFAVYIYGSFIGKLAFKSPDTAWGGTQADHMTHNDCIQFQGGGGVTVVHSRIEGSIDPAIGDAMLANQGAVSGSGHTGGNPNYTGGAATDTNMLAPGACFMLSPYGGGLTGPLTITDCEIGYAHSWVNPNASYTSLSFLTMKNNRWIKKGRDVNFAGSWNSLKGSATMSGNRWAYTGDGHNAGDTYNG